MIFQDPYASLNPRKNVEQIVGQPFAVHGGLSGREREAASPRAARTVGLSREHASRYPHEFSGGQRQRIGIARALGLNPKLIVCDEPVSALDVSVQAQILNLLRSLQQEFDLTYVFISHDLSVMRQICTRIAVMYLGRIVELAESERIFEQPRHPYTAVLISACAAREHERQRGELGSSSAATCRRRSTRRAGASSTRAALASTRVTATVTEPVLEHVPGDSGHVAACYYPLERWPMDAAAMTAGTAATVAPES